MVQLHVLSNRLERPVLVPVQLRDEIPVGGPVLGCRVGLPWYRQHPRRRGAVAVTRHYCSLYHGRRIQILSSRRPQTGGSYIVARAQSSTGQSTGAAYPIGRLPMRRETGAWQSAAEQECVGLGPEKHVVCVCDPALSASYPLKTATPLFRSCSGGLKSNMTFKGLVHDLLFVPRQCKRESLRSLGQCSKRSRKCQWAR